MPDDFLSRLKSNGIDTGIEGLTLTDETLEVLKIKSADFKKYKSAASKAMDSSKHAPVDVFEWRLHHRRLCDYWILPIIAHSTVGLIWARMTEHSDIVEKHDDEIDNLSLLEFLVTLIVWPSRPFYLIAMKFKSETFVDDVISWFLLGKMASELVCFMSDCSTTIQGKGFMPLTYEGWVLSLRSLCFIVFNYYVTYWIISNFLNDTWFYFNVYCVLPLMLVGYSLPFIWSIFEAHVTDTKKFI